MSAAPRSLLTAALALSLVLGVAPPASTTPIKRTMVLQTSWLKRHKNVVTTTSMCEIHHVHPRPNDIGRSGDDGDLHMACRCATVKLPMVGEIVNAAKFPDVVRDANDVAGTGTKRRITGAWRLWLEHPSKHSQTQGQPVPMPHNTNPEHSFEIHPLTEFGSHDLNGSFVRIPGYEAYKAKTAFPYYEKRKFTVSRSGPFTSITGIQSKYNYAEFDFTAAGKSETMTDGWAVLATIDGVTDSLRRMVAPNGTTPATLIRTAKKGSRFRAIGIPRISLERIDRELIAHPGVPSEVTGAYEMIIVSLAKKN